MTRTTLLMLLLASTNATAGEPTQEALVEKFRRACATDALAGTESLFHATEEAVEPIQDWECGNVYRKPIAEASARVTLYAPPSLGAEPATEPSTTMRVRRDRGTWDLPTDEPYLEFDVVKIDGEYFLRRQVACDL